MRIKFRNICFLVVTGFLASCARYGPYRANTAAEPTKSVLGPTDSRYKLAFVEFGDQGSALDTSQRAAAINVIHKAQRPLLFVYIHGWQNDAVSGDVGKFEHFLDGISKSPEVVERKFNVIGVYIAWRGRDLTIPGLDLLTFWNRKSAGNELAEENSCLATLNELAIAARDPGKKFHRCILIGHSFGGLVLENTIAHSILDASSTGQRNSCPWDMAVAINPADNAISTRQLMSELDYLYKYDAARQAYVGRAPGAVQGSSVDENRPLLIILQSENDLATGKFFPIGTGLGNTLALRYHWDQVPVPGSKGQTVSEGELDTHTPGNEMRLVNYQVKPLGAAAQPPGLLATENKAFEANMLRNLHGLTFYTSEKNAGPLATLFHNSEYNPDDASLATGNNLWRRWEFVYTGNARVPCWVVRVPKEIIWGHGGFWSDNSVAMFGALYRLHFPLSASGASTTSPPVRVPNSPDLDHLQKDKAR